MHGIIANCSVCCPAPWNTLPHPYPGFSERLALIPFESPAIVGSSPCSDAVGRAGHFSGMCRTRHGCRPNRTPAAGRRDRRQPIGPPQPFPSPRRARQAKPGASPICGLPLVQPPRRFRCAHGTAAVASRLDAVEACLPRSVGQRVCLPLPCQKIRDKGACRSALDGIRQVLLYYAQLACGGMAERLGSGLQIRLQRFNSASHLQRGLA